MKQICYVSFIADGLNGHEVVESIKEVSLRKNPIHGITGLLIYTNEVFIQILEGEELNVDITYKIIQHDKRHSNIDVIFEQRIFERAFPNWDMRFFYVEELDIETINKILRFKNSIGEDSLTKEKIFDLFNIFLESEQISA